MKLDLRHYSREPVERLWPASVYRFPRPSKPGGFWVSVDDNSEGWREWCNEQQFEVEHLAYAYKITLKNDARILYITTDAELHTFTEQYKSDHKLNLHSDFVHAIDWPRLAEKYQGIIITPYLWRSRNDFRTFWYYGWDCASGCIWDIDAIAGIKLIKAKEHAA